MGGFGYMRMIGAGISSTLQGLDAFSQAEANKVNQRYQASVAFSNAAAMRQQAEITRKTTEAALREKDKEREQLRRAYESEAGSNRALLAASGVDITSGSAEDLLLGNAENFATDAGENRLARAWTNWSGKRQADLETWQSDVQKSRGRFLEKTAGNTGKSLLTGFLVANKAFADRM